MDKIKTREIKQTFEKEGIIFCYSGAVSHELLDAIGRNVKEKIEKEDADAQMGKKVFSIFIEAVQNIKNYSHETIPLGDSGARLKVGVVIIRKNNNQFIIETGNEISIENKSSLETKLNKLKSMNPDEIKTFYKEERTKPIEMGSNSGGLGLIEIARRSTRPIEYEIEDIDSETAFYTLRVAI